MQVKNSSRLVLIITKFLAIGPNHRLGPSLLVMAIAILLAGGRVFAGPGEPQILEPQREYIQSSTPPASRTTVSITTITIPTHAVDNALTYRFNAAYNMYYAQLDRGRYDAGRIENRTYNLIILENDYLKLSFLPELGGRIYQAIFKPTGNNIFYQNPVLKPSPWGPPEMGWWLAVGGMEWGLPVEEHGYEWGIPWHYQVSDLADGAQVMLWDSSANNRLRAKIVVTLPDDAAFFQVMPIIENPTAAAIDFKFWLNAMLAPGPTNQVGADLRFILPGRQVTVHSTGDPRLPGAGKAAGWPGHNGVDWSRLGNWREWYGFFQRPRAAGDYQAIYDENSDEGVVRSYNSKTAQGAKFFAFGYGSAALPPDLYTDDRSGYVEMHGGVAPTFADTRRLEPHASLSWDEYWYPVAGLGGLTWANRHVALYLEKIKNEVQLHLAVTRPLDEVRILVLRRATNEVLYQEDVAQIRPGEPYHTPALPVALEPDAVAVLIYKASTLLATYQYNGGPIITPTPVTATPLPPATPTPTISPSSSVTPIPSPTATAAHAVTATAAPTSSPTPTATPTPSATATASPTLSPTSTPSPLSTITPVWQGRVRRIVPIAGWASVVRIWVDKQVGQPVTLKSANPRWHWQATGYTGSKPEYGSDALEFAPLPPLFYSLTAPDLPARLDFELLPGTVTEIVFEQIVLPTATATPTPTPTPTLTPAATKTATPTLTPIPTGTVAAQTSTPAATAFPTPTLSRTPTTILTPTASPTATPSATPEPTWHVRVPTNITIPGNWFAVIRVSVEGKLGLPVRITIVTADQSPWSTTCLTGSKPEYGPYFCEFSPLIPAQYIISLDEFDIKTTVTVQKGGVAVVIFEEY
ncbi:MAG: DUF5107 domain-containing protein [Anaerolineae bacterium]|nr:DUF5107 domain-containing protein [Anaerolineae bacterium]